MRPVAGGLAPGLGPSRISLTIHMLSLSSPVRGICIRVSAISKTCICPLYSRSLPNVQLKRKGKTMVLPLVACVKCQTGCLSMVSCVRIGGTVGEQGRNSVRLSARSCGRRRGPSGRRRDDTLTVGRERILFSGPVVRGSAPRSAGRRSERLGNSGRSSRCGFSPVWNRLSNCCGRCGRLSPRREVSRFLSPSGLTSVPSRRARGIVS